MMKSFYKCVSTESRNIKTVPLPYRGKSHISVGMISKSEICEMARVMELSVSPEETMRTVVMPQRMCDAGRPTEPQRDTVNFMSISETEIGIGEYLSIDNV